MNKYALLFGLNYKHCSSGQLRGCINDVKMMSTYLRDNGFNVESHTDDIALEETSKAGMLKSLNAAAAKSWRDNLDVIWIHFSGHGSQIEDTTGDEEDGQDECLVPSDYETAGFITDDDINDLCGIFNPKTHVIFVFDCCHSGTMADLKYCFDEKKNATIENSTCGARGRIITLSGCKDEQTSSDAWGVAGQIQFTGALTACLLDVLKDQATHDDVFHMMKLLHAKLIEGRFSQRPLLGSTYDLRDDPKWIPKVPYTHTHAPVPPVAPKPPAFAQTPSHHTYDDLDDLYWKKPKRQECCFQ